MTTFTAITGAGRSSSEILVDGKAEFIADAAMGAAGTYFDLLTEGTTPGVSGNASPSGWVFEWTGATPSLLRITDTGQLRHTWTTGSAVKEIYAVRYFSVGKSVRDLVDILVRWKPKFAPMSGHTPPNGTYHGYRFDAWDPSTGLAAGSGSGFNYNYNTNKIAAYTPGANYYQPGVASPWLKDFDALIHYVPGFYSVMDDRAVAGSLRTMLDTIYGASTPPAYTDRGWYTQVETYLRLQIRFVSGAATTDTCDGGFEAPVMSFR